MRCTDEKTLHPKLPSGCSPPTAGENMADLDKLFNFFFKRLAKAKVFLGPPERVATEVLTIAFSKSP